MLYTWRSSCDGLRSYQGGMLAVVCGELLSARRADHRLKGDKKET